MDMDLINAVVTEEWQQFQQVNRQQPKAWCQNAEEEFRQMRSSQFMVWPEEMVASYYIDLLNAKEIGANLVMEKYAFMMRDTAPEEFKELEPYLQKISLRKRKMIEEIVILQGIMAEKFAKEYPYYAAQGRKTYTNEGSIGGTSVASYLRGELSSYSEHTVGLYYEFVKKCAATDVNLTSLVRTNMAKMHGYSSLEEVENTLKQRRERMQN